MDGAVKFNVSADTAQFDAAMARVGSAATTTSQRISAAFSGLGAALAGGAVVAGVQNILRQMDDISDRAKRFGVSAEEIQKVGNAANLVGTNFESVARTIARAGVAANRAAREGGAIAEAFDRVNLNPAQFAAATLEDRIKMIAAAQRAANGDAVKMAEILEVIGVRAANINFLELASEMDNVNAASSDVVERLAEANDQLDKMKQNATIFGANLLKALLVDPAQRLGSLLGGEGFKTIEEVQQKYERLIAKNSLQNAGRLLVNSQGQPFEEQSFSPNTKQGREDKEKALENERRITAEVERLKKAQEEVATASRDAALAAQDYEGAVSRANDKLEQKKKLVADSARLQRQYSPEQSANLALVRETKNQAVAEFQSRLEQLESSGRPQAEIAAQVDTLKQKFDEVMEKARRASEQIINDAIRRSSEAQAQMLQRSSETERQKQDRQMAAATSPEKQDIATETTLQKAVQFLQELTGKLPQPVLA